MPIGRPPFYQDAPGGLTEKPLADARGSRPPRRPSRLTSAASGATGTGRRSTRSRTVGRSRGPASPATRSRRRAWRSRRTRPASPPASSSSTLIQVLELRLMRAAPRFTPADRLRALRGLAAPYAARGVTACTRATGSRPRCWRLPAEPRAGRAAVRCALGVSPTWDAAEAGGAIPELAAWAGGRGLGDDRLRVSGVCLHYGGDAGAPASCTRPSPTPAGPDSWRAPTAPRLSRAGGSWPRRPRLRVTTLVNAACRMGARRVGAWRGAIPSRPALGPRSSERSHLEQLARIRRLGAVATTKPISYLYRSAGDEAASSAAADQLLPHRSLAATASLRIATDNSRPTRGSPSRRWWPANMRTGTVVGARLTRAQALAALTRAAPG